MRAYPTVKETPNRKQRKAMRRNIFAENKADAATRRRARRDARRAANASGN
jgi:hypothetical protein